jgi:hypothetical protein
MTKGNQLHILFHCFKHFICLLLVTLTKPGIQCYKDIIHNVSDAAALTASPMQNKTLEDTLDVIQV